jgi:hypothetical protein
MLNNYVAVASPSYAALYGMTWLDLANQNDILHTGYKSKGQKCSTLS